MTAVLAAAASSAVTVPITMLVLRHQLVTIAVARLRLLLDTRRAEQAHRREVEASNEAWFAHFKASDPAITVEWFAITAEPHDDDAAPDEVPTPGLLRTALWLPLLALPQRLAGLWHDLRTGSQRDDTPGDLADPTPAVPEETVMGRPTSPDQPPTDDGPVPPPHRGRHRRDPDTGVYPIVVAAEARELVSA